MIEGVVDAPEPLALHVDPAGNYSIPASFSLYDQVLDTAVTPELAAEGLARDLVRAVQQARRDARLDVSDRISLTVEGGEIHCLLGENGAGKSTLMNVLYGLYRADGGEICASCPRTHR